MCLQDVASAQEACQCVSTKHEIENCQGMRSTYMQIKRMGPDSLTWTFFTRYDDVNSVQLVHRSVHTRIDADVRVMTDIINITIMKFPLWPKILWYYQI